MRGMSKSLLIAVAVLAIVVVALVAYYALTPTTPKAPYKITIYTGGTGGIYYPIGVKLADLLNKYAGDKITATAVSSGASVTNMRALGAGDANMALTQNDVAYYAYHGLFMFNGTKISNVRGWPRFTLK